MSPEQFLKKALISIASDYGISEIDPRIESAMVKYRRGTYKGNPSKMVADFEKELKALKVKKVKSNKVL